MIVDQSPLFSVTGALARASDPQTSVDAAEAVDSHVGRGVEHAVYAAFTLRDWTDEELAEYLTDVYGPTAKSARSRLSKWHKGRAPLLKDSGVRRPSHRGRDQIVWTKAT